MKFKCGDILVDQWSLHRPTVMVLEVYTGAQHNDAAYRTLTLHMEGSTNRRNDRVFGITYVQAYLVHKYFKRLVHNEI